MKEERFPHTRSPFADGDCGWRRRKASELRRRKASELRRRAQQRVQGAERRDSCTEDWCRPALTRPRGLSAHPPGRAGLGAEARASVGAQGEDRRCENSLQGVSAPRLAGRESRKSLDLPMRQETSFSLFVSWCARRGSSRDGHGPRLEARTPETGMRC